MNIIESNGVFSIGGFTATHDKLPVGVYLLKFDPKAGYFLNKKPDFILPKKVYGDHSVIHRWITSYNENSEKNLGIILSGQKGTGKTITAQKFCIEAQKPVIIINEAYEGSDFIDFITSFEDVIIFIDEFEKVYPEGYNAKVSSADFLSMMDGNYQTKLIFLLTVNKFTINEYLVNRLNRVKYRKHYMNLEQEVIEEVIEDFLDNKEHKESIYKFFEKVNMCTFDLLINIIKEMNLFKEDALQCALHLNLECENRLYQIYEYIDGSKMKHGKQYLSGKDTQIAISRVILPKNLDENLDSNWNVYVNLSEAIITKISNSSFILETPDKKNKFIFEEESNYSLLF